jgi:hypothetical protein
VNKSRVGHIEPGEGLCIDGTGHRYLVLNYIRSFETSQHLFSRLFWKALDAVLVEARSLSTCNVYSSFTAPTRRLLHWLALRSVNRRGTKTKIEGYTDDQIAAICEMWKLGASIDVGAFL